MEKHKEETHGWTNQKSRCDFAGWWDCSFFCNKLSKKEKIIPCGFNVPDFERCKRTGYIKMKKNRVNRFIWQDSDFHLQLTPANLPADAVARQAMPGFKAGNYLIDEHYRLSRNNPQQKEEENQQKLPHSTKLEDIVAYYTDIKAQENLAFIRVSCGSDKSEMFRYLKEKRREIDKRYERILKQQDCYSFKGLDELMNFLCSTDLFPTKEIINRTLHEQKHSNEAIARGYKVNIYQCWLCLNRENKPDYVTVTQIKTLKLPPEEDYRAITAAPTDQSIIDSLSVPTYYKKEKRKK